MSSEQELLSQLEQLRNKQKEMENTKVSIEFKKQKDYLINKLKTFLDMDIKDSEIISIYNDDNYLENHFKYYFKIEDEDNNLLFRRRVYNRHAQKNFIRYREIPNLSTLFQRVFKFGMVFHASSKYLI